MAESRPVEPDVDEAVGGPAPAATERLRLRRWREDDREPFHQLNADPRVMATIGPVMDRPASDRYLDQIEAHFADHGFGLWCVESDGEPIGFTGLHRPAYRDGVEIGWRIRSHRWGNGYATEAARSVLAFAFEVVGLDEVISFTSTVNERSMRVMEKIGLRRDPDGDFDHPALAPDDPLRPHVLYRLGAQSYRAEVEAGRGERTVGSGPRHDTTVPAARDSSAWLFD